MTQSALGVIALYTGSDSVGPFALTDVRNSSPILFEEDNEITVRIYDPDDEVFPLVPSWTDLTEAVDYTISGAGGTVAGSVTLATALTSGWKLVMFRRVDQTQTLDFEFGGATPDATNKLSVNSPAILFNRETDDIQVKLNKEATGDTASFLFQTGFSGRAEIGLVGDDDFVFKVSPDGNSFIEGIRIDKDSGRVSFPQTPAFGITRS